MVKKILIISAIYVLLTLLLILKKDALTEEYYIALTVFLSLVFAAFIIKEVWFRYLGDHKPQNNQITYQNPETPNFTHRKLISQKPFLFGLEKKFVDEHDFYFDDQHFYAINRAGQQAVYPLTAIVELSKTSVRMNNRQIWQVKVTHNHQVLVFKFAHNYSLWNKNFTAFYTKMQQTNPSAVKSKWSLWTM